MALEEEFWVALTRLAASQGRSLGALVAEIDAQRAQGEMRGVATTGGEPGGRPLASALRVHALLATR